MSASLFVFGYYKLVRKDDRKLIYLTQLYRWQACQRGDVNGYVQLGLIFPSRLIEAASDKYLGMLRSGSCLSSANGRKPDVSDFSRPVWKETQMYVSAFTFVGLACLTTGRSADTLDFESETAHTMRTACQRPSSGPADVTFQCTGTRRREPAGHC